ncbi:MAG: hypothetical protein ACXAC2_14730 [Candidatus Kariarchaeaceae archaeon]
MTKKNISIPRSVFKTAEQLAKSLGMSLSEFYTAALSAYIESYKNNSSVTEKLNQIYKTESSSIDPEMVKIQVASLGDETW